jgi:hypothetical protein
MGPDDGDGAVKGWMAAITFVAVWVAGGAIFDAALQLNGGWLMLGGVVTYMVASKAADWAAK